ncbi:MAG: hypothetical protein JXA90_04415 [Planctomycetes bacterium]|nr:hypothetical protein [Planctomycetota bacterium]
MSRLLEDVRDQIRAGIREEGLAAGFLRGIDRLRDLLSESFPAGEGLSSEISDEVIVLDA